MSETRNIFDAIQSRKVEAITSVLADKKNDINAKNEDGETALIYAIRELDDEILGDVSKKTLSKIQVVKFLLEHKANPNEIDNRKYTALNYLITRYNDEEILKLMLNSGIEVNRQPTDEDSPPPYLHHAINMDNENAVKALLEAKANVNILDLNKNTPLHIAANVGSVEIFVALINAGADIDAKNAVGDTPLQVAKKRQRADILKELETRGYKDVSQMKVDFNSISTTLNYQPSSEGLEAQLDNLKRLEPDAVKKILEQQDRDGNTLLHLAGRGHGVTSTNMFKLVLQLYGLYKANINLRNKEGKTPLRSMISETGFYASPHEKIKALLQHGPDITIPDNNGKTPLDIARNDKNVRILLEASLLVKGSTFSVSNPQEASSTDENKGFSVGPPRKS